MTFACSDCGARLPVVKGCGVQALCRRCALRWWSDTRRRLLRATSARDAEAAAAWRRAGQPRRGRRIWHLWTLTVRHTGDLAADRATIQRAWERLRAWLHKRLREDPAQRRQTARPGQFHFAFCWETTPGRDGLGHLHAHVVVLVPYIPYSLLHEEWKHATDGVSVNIDCGRGTKDGPISPVRAAKYIAKYASKGTEVHDFPAELAANAIDASWMRRKVSASHGLWEPRAVEPCRSCGGLDGWHVAEHAPVKRYDGPPVWSCTFARAGPAHGPPTDGQPLHT